MAHDRLQASVRAMVHVRVRVLRSPWQRYVMLLVLFVSSEMLFGFADAGERARPVRIGALTSSWGPSPQVVGLRDGLVELGYREYEHFILGVRFTAGDLAALPAAARELVQYGVDLLFADSDHAAKAAQLATTQIPIVFAAVGDPVGMGLIQSFARPGATITGVTTLALELAPKRLEFFREIVPGLTRVLFPYDANDAYAVEEARVYREAAHRLGIELVEKPLQTQEEAQATLTQARKGEVDGILKPRHGSLNIPGFMLEASAQGAIPTMFDGTWYVERGGLASYGLNTTDAGRQAARLVDKILKGAAPVEIPVEVSMQFEFAINLQTANALGVPIAPEVLYRADRIVR